MNKLADLLPFLIMVVVGIISVVRKMKKIPSVKEVLASDEVFPEQPPLILNKLIPEKKVVTPVTSRIPISGKIQQTVEEQSIETQDMDESVGFSIDFSDPDEIKRAVIYSEIFNRKDF
jgi:5,10-methenyltetrahydromethanopterin hydrogenase